MAPERGGRQASGLSEYRPKATKAAIRPIGTAQTSGLVAASFSEYRADRPLGGLEIQQRFAARKVDRH
jgi:hypothetical protein